jgi:hypothetical protein
MTTTAKSPGRQAELVIATSNSLADLAARIRAEHEASAAALKSSVEHAMAAGALLIEAKDRLNQHGQWLPWLREHCALSERVAQTYMRLARNRETIEAKSESADSGLTIRGAVALLAPPPATLPEIEPALPNGFVLPAPGRARVGTLIAPDGIEYFVIIPSPRHRGFYHLGHFENSPTVDGAHNYYPRPVRPEGIWAFFSRMRSRGSPDGLEDVTWNDAPASDWELDANPDAPMGWSTEPSKQINRNRRT